MGWNFVIAFVIALFLIWSFYKVVELIVDWLMRGIKRRKAKKHFESTERYRREF